MLPPSLFIVLVLPVICRAADTTNSLLLGGDDQTNRVFSESMVLDAESPFDGTHQSVLPKEILADLKRHLDVKFPDEYWRPISTTSRAVPGRTPPYKALEDEDIMEAPSRVPESALKLHLNLKLSYLIGSAVEADSDPIPPMIIEGMDYEHKRKKSDLRLGPRAKVPSTTLLSDNSPPKGPAWFPDSLTRPVLAFDISPPSVRPLIYFSERALMGDSPRVFGSWINDITSGMGCRITHDSMLFLDGYANNGIAQDARESMFQKGAAGKAITSDMLNDQDAFSGSYPLMGHGLAVVLDFNSKAKERLLVRKFGSVPLGVAVVLKFGEKRGGECFFMVNHTTDQLETYAVDDGDAIVVATSEALKNLPKSLDQPMDAKTLAQTLFDLNPSRNGLVAVSVIRNAPRQHRVPYQLMTKPAIQDC
jgi:hypothetical protein